MKFFWRESRRAYAGGNRESTDCPQNKGMVEVGLGWRIFGKCFWDGLDG